MEAGGQKILILNILFLPMKNKVLISEAIKILGVSLATMNRWVKRGVIVPSIHPINGYRLFDRKTLEELRDKIGA